MLALILHVDDNVSGLYWCATESNLFTVVACMPALHAIFHKMLRKIRGISTYGSRGQYDSEGAQQRVIPAPQHRSTQRLHTFRSDQKGHRCHDLSNRTIKLRGGVGGQRRAEMMLVIMTSPQVAFCAIGVEQSF